MVKQYLSLKIESVQPKNIVFNKAELPEDINIPNPDSVRIFKEITKQYASKAIFTDV